MPYITLGCIIANSLVVILLLSVGGAWQSILINVLAAAFNILVFKTRYNDPDYNLPNWLKRCV